MKHKMIYCIINVKSIKHLIILCNNFQMQLCPPKAIIALKCTTAICHCTNTIAYSMELGHVDQYY